MPIATTRQIANTGMKINVLEALGNLLPIFHRYQNGRMIKVIRVKESSWDFKAGMEQWMRPKPRTSWRGGVERKWRLNVR